METYNRNATEHARLGSAVCGMDAKEMSRWVERLQTEYGDKLHNNRYQSVFRSFGMDGGDMLIGGLGRLAGMRISVSHTKITGSLDLDGAVFYTEEDMPETGFDSIPFEAVFSLCGRLREKLKSLIDPEFYCVPFLGGIKSVMLSEEPQEIVDYYLPELVLFGSGNRFRLFSAAHIPEHIPLESLPDSGKKKGFCRVKSRTECPGKAEYVQGMNHVLDELRQDTVQKVVVARRCTITPEDSFHCCDYAAHLYDRYFQEYYFMFRQGEEAMWIGISPEIIMKQQGGRAVTKPLAGTRSKSEDAAQNTKILQDLTSANKDIVEHEHALYFMVDQLQRAGIGEVKIDKNKTVLETPYAFHIKSEISMALKENVSCFDIIGAIYPPATIWGIPVDRTERLLARTEPFDRGYYSGVYGYWNYEGIADTALVIRSAKVENGTVSVYAGGGIVKLSNIDAEFDETVNKMGPLLSYFQED